MNNKVLINWSKLVHICLNLFEIGQIGPDLSNLNRKLANSFNAQFFNNSDRKNQLTSPICR